MIIRDCPSAGIYFSHYECFGHTSRVMAVGEVFKKRFPSGNLFFIQAGVRQPNAEIDQLGRVYSLPGAFMDRRNFREPIRGAGTNAGERSKACADIVTRGKPNLFITEFFPFGREECRHELIPSLIQASSQGAVLWAVAGYPLLTGINNGWREKILELYRKIIIFAPLIEKEMIAASFTNALERQRYNDFFERHEKKIVFAGYLLPQGEIVNCKEDENLPKPLMPQGACRVAVVRGGGAYYPKIIAEAIRASDFLGEEYYLTVVAGPSTTPEEWYLFSTLIAKKKVKNVALLKSVVDYEGLIRGSDVCVATASYHTAVMLLKYWKKAVIIPFEGYGKEMSFQEQPARAAMLKEIIGAEILPAQDLTAVSLVAFIKDASHRQRTAVDIPKDWFMGADFLDKALTGLSLR